MVRRSISGTGLVKRTNGRVAQERTDHTLPEKHEGNGLRSLCDMYLGSLIQYIYFPTSSYPPEYMSRERKPHPDFPYPKETIILAKLLTQIALSSRPVV
jgi:hypothetical protein